VPTYAAIRSQMVDEDGDGRYDALEIETRHLLATASTMRAALPFHRDGNTVIKERIFSRQADTTSSITRSPCTTAR